VQRFAGRTWLLRFIPHIHWFNPLLMAWVLGTAAQLFQPTLWPWWAYAGILLAVLMLSVLAASQHRPTINITLEKRHFFKLCVVVLLTGCFAFASVGSRAQWFQSQRLTPSLEGIDLQVTGVVAAMPQWQTDGLRFRFEVQSAARVSDAQAVQIPDDIQLTWYKPNRYPIYKQESNGNSLCV
jgi:competence protein ComEC